MKRVIFSFLSVLLVLGSTAQNLIKMAPQIVVVNIGPKNPHFDESIYPHLKFYYTPGLKAILPNENAMNKKFDLSGEPEFLVRAFNERHIKQFGFLLFDKNGVCYTEGNDFLESVEIAKALCSNGKELGENIKDVVKKGKTAKVKSGPLPWGRAHMALKGGLRHTAIVKSTFLTGHPFPENLRVETVSGQKVSIESVIKGKPTLVVFLYIPPTGNFETMDKYYNGNAPKPSEPIRKKYIKDVLHLAMLEGQFFDFNPKKALKAKYGK
jgi:hypothetical protein